MKFDKLLVYNITESETLNPSTWKKIKSLANKTVFVALNHFKLNKELHDADAVLINFGTEFGKKEIDSAPRLKYIGVMATAFGKIDIEYAKKKKIVVANLKGYSTESGAEFVIAAVLEHARGLEEGKTRGRSKNYSELGISAIELKDKIFGIIGMGTIGKRVAEIAQGFSSDVRYWSKHRKKDYEKRGIKFEDFNKLITEADFISVNLAQNTDTEEIFDKKVFDKLKKGSVVINTAPMELIDLTALAGRLQKKDIVFILDHSDEMSEEDLNKISKYPNCIIYPPMAYISREAADNKKRIFVGNIEAFLKGKPQNVVN